MSAERQRWREKRRLQRNGLLPMRRYDDNEVVACLVTAVGGLLFLAVVTLIIAAIDGAL